MKMTDMKELYQQYQVSQGCVEGWKKDVNAGKEQIKDTKTRLGGLEENLKTAEKVYSERERDLKQALSAHITEQRTAFTRAQKQLKKGKVENAYLIITGQEPQAEVPEKEQPIASPVQAVEPKVVIRMVTKTLYGVNREKSQTLWQCKVNSCRPIFAQDEERVFVADYKTLVALDRKTGEEISRKQLGDDYIDALLQEDGILFVASNTNLFAYDAKNLQKQWETGILNYILALAKSGDNLFVGGHYSSGGILALDSKTGKEKWKKGGGDLDSAACHLAGGVNNEGSVYAANCFTGRVKKLDQDGKQVWEIGNKKEILPAVMKAHHDALYVGSRHGYVNALDANTGKEKWESRIGGDFAFPWQIDVWQGKLEVVITDPYYASECKVINLDPHTGKLI